MLDVVGTLYFKDNKLLLVKPSRRPCLQMVGGKIEPGETIYEAAYRESCEELGPNASVDKDKFKFIMDFVGILFVLN